MQGILHAFLTESLKSSRRDSQSTTDESVDSFVRRRLGPNAADNLISAMIHGIYAGDSRQLSIRAVFPSLWKMETERGSITAGMLLSRFTEETKKTAESIEKIQNSLKQETRNKLRQASVWSLKEGIEGLSTRLIDRLRAMPNVELIPSAKVTSIRTQDQQPIQVSVAHASWESG